ncbi:MAG: WG repeat-containing protein, partial [Lentisphaeria bacterium]|nr:WG repeat-containing protein [Lentisphaeria bacterium]
MEEYQPLCRVCKDQRVRHESAGAGYYQYAAQHNQSGKEILPPVYDEIWEDDIEGTSLHVQYKGKIGVWDNNMFVIPLLYDDIYLFRYGSKKYWSVVKDGKHGLLRENSRTMFSAKYSSISYCKNRDNNQEIDFVVSLGDKFQRYTGNGKYIEDIQ